MCHDIFKLYLESFHDFLESTASNLLSQQFETTPVRCGPHSPQKKGGGARFLRCRSVGRVSSRKAETLSSRPSCEVRIVGSAKLPSYPAVKRLDLGPGGSLYLVP